MDATLIVLFGALVLDRVFGEPAWLYARLPHPVVVMGNAITRLERWLYAWPDKRIAGTVLMAIMVGGSWALGIVLAQFWLIELFLIAALLAQKSLLDHVRAVAVGLRAGLDQGRIELGKIVGRDTASLDQAAIARAANESLAENMVDGVTSPLFWALIGGLPGIMAYKALNALDSMVGHKNEKYQEFGWASARLDDLANWLPARLTGFAYCGLGALFGYQAFGTSTAIMRRCAPTHKSPNAGWPEAGMAAVLEQKLGGPQSYGNQWVNNGFMGEGRSNLGPDDIDQALTLSGWLLNILLISFGLAALLTL